MSDTAALIAAIVLLLARFLGIRGLGYGVDGWRSTRSRSPWTFNDIAAHRQAFANTLVTILVAGMIALWSLRDPWMVTADS